MPKDYNHYILNMSREKTLVEFQVMMNPREGLILALNRLDVQTIFVSSMDTIMYVILPIAEISTICVERPFGFLKFFQSCEPKLL